MAGKAQTTKRTLETQDPVTKAYKKLAVPELSKAQLKKLDDLNTVSARIRYMDSEGYNRSEIAAALTKHRNKLVRYQHVRNVLITPVAGQAS